MIRAFLTDLRRFRKVARRRGLSLAALFRVTVDSQVEASIREGMAARPWRSVCPFCQEVQPADHVCVKPEDREERPAVQVIRRSEA